MGSSSSKKKPQAVEKQPQDQHDVPTKQLAQPVKVDVEAAAQPAPEPLPAEQQQQAAGVDEHTAWVDEHVKEKEEEREAQIFSQRGIEKKRLLFTFEINWIEFNRIDRSQKLCLTLDSLSNSDNYSGVLVNDNDWPDFRPGHVTSTDVIRRRTGATGESLSSRRDQFRINKFDFILPKGKLDVLFFRFFKL